MLPFQTKNGKRKPRRLSLIHLLFAHRTNGSNPLANGLNGLAHLCLVHMLSSHGTWRLR